MITVRTGIAEVDDELARYAEASGSLAAAVAAAAAAEPDPENGPEARALGRLRDAHQAVDLARADVIASLRGDATAARRRLADARAALLTTRSDIAPELRRVTARRLSALQLLTGTAQIAWEAAGAVFVAVSELGIDVAFTAEPGS